MVSIRLRKNTTINGTCHEAGKVVSVSETAADLIVNNGGGDRYPGQEPDPPRSVISGAPRNRDATRIKPLARSEDAKAAGKLTLAIDFGGVIHSYTSGFQGVDKVGDPPTEGSIEFLKEATESFQVYLLSARFHKADERDVATKAVLDWFENNGLSRDWFTVEPDLTGKIVLASIKPRAHALIDDRAFRFEGVFPPVSDLLKLKPWNR